MFQIRKCRELFALVLYNWFILAIFQISVDIKRVKQVSHSTEGPGVAIDIATVVSFDI